MGENNGKAIWAVYWVADDLDDAMSCRGIECTDVAGAALLLGVSTGAVHQMARRSTLVPVTRNGRGNLFSVGEVLALARKKRTMDRGVI